MEIYSYISPFTNETIYTFTDTDGRNYSLATLIRHSKYYKNMMFADPEGASWAIRMAWHNAKDFTSAIESMDEFFRIHLDQKNLAAWIAKKRLEEKKEEEFWDSLASGGDDTDYSEIASDGLASAFEGDSGAYWNVD